MALDIGVGDGTSFLPIQTEPLLSLEDDGYYWFLEPLFERLKIETRQSIDLVDDATFAGEDLAALERMLIAAQELVGSQPPKWNVCVGSVLEPRQKGRRPHLEKIYMPVERRRFEQIFLQWKRIVDRAKELRCPVVCFGD